MSTTRLPAPVALNRNFRRWNKIERKKNARPEMRDALERNKSSGASSAKSRNSDPNVKPAQQRNIVTAVRIGPNLTNSNRNDIQYACHNHTYNMKM